MSIYILKLKKNLEKNMLMTHGLVVGHRRPTMLAWVDQEPGVVVGQLMIQL
jgi:hypothetical protein